MVFFTQNGFVWRTLVIYYVTKIYPNSQSIGINTSFSLTWISFKLMVVVFAVSDPPLYTYLEYALDAVS